MYEIIRTCFYFVAYLEPLSPLLVLTGQYKGPPVNVIAGVFWERGVLTLKRRYSITDESEVKEKVHRV
jgi:hypothetical protein